MAKELVKEALTYRVDTETEAVAEIEKVKNAQAAEGYTVKKSEYSLRQKKAKGEVIEEWFLVTVTKVYGE
jgi:hypothetical protein